jgi:hypothetical protein
MLVAIDFETLLIAPGLQAPPPVCMSVATSVTDGFVVPTPAARDAFVGLLRDPGVTLIGHNLAYDLCCAIAWWDCAAEVVAALEADRVLDTMLAERLAEIGGATKKGSLALDKVHEYYGLGELPKGLVRVSYGPLLDQPLAAYSAEQIKYAVDDSLAVLRVRARQVARHRDVHDADVAALLRKLVWLTASRNYGMRTSPDRISGLGKTAAEHLEGLRRDATILGVLRPDGTKNMAVLRGLISEAYGGRPPMTTKPKEKKGAKPRKKAFVPQVKTGGSVLEESGDPRLQAIADLGEWLAVERMVLPAYSRGTYEPIHTRYTFADTTRVNSSSPNLLNVRRAVGIRECFHPRPGYVFISIDHGGLENATLAQCMIWFLGDRRLADFINDGGDLHCKTGSEIYGCTYDEALAYHAQEYAPFEEARGAAKPVNFGRPGGAGWKTLQFIARSIYGLTWSEVQTKQYIRAWERAVPAGPAYHDWVNRRPQDREGKYTIQIPGTTITRRGVTFCSAANNGFQGLGTVVEGEVGWSMFRERMTPGSVLSACAHVLFVHDEHIWEVPESLVTEAGERLAWHMTEVPRRLMPAVKLTAEAKAMRYWSKKAKRIVKNGELIPWE